MERGKEEDDERGIEGWRKRDRGEGNGRVERGRKGREEKWKGGEMEGWRKRDSEEGNGRVERSG